MISDVCLLMILQGIHKFFHEIFTQRSCLFSMLLNDDIVDIEKPYGIYSPAFVVHDFGG